MKLTYLDLIAAFIPLLVVFVVGATLDGLIGGSNDHAENIVVAAATVTGVFNLLRKSEASE